MAVEANIETLFQDIRLDELWLPPKPWESVPSESGQPSSVSSFPACSASSSYYDGVGDLSSITEASLLRLVMNALQGMQSALISIEKLSALFCAEPADRSAHRIPTIWKRLLSTHALGKMLKSIGFAGTSVLLLYRFVEHFTGLNRSALEVRLAGSVLEGGQVPENKTIEEHSSCSLVNQAFAVAVRKVLSAYICALDTVNSSAHSRRSVHSTSVLNGSPQPSNTVVTVHSGITVLELYLHTKELRTQIETLGNLCRLHSATLCFSEISMDELVTKASTEFCDFPRGGHLLSYLYDQLQVADPVHSTLVKFLFLQSLEPYCGFIRSCIYEGKLSDPYGEFVLQYDGKHESSSNDKSHTATEFPVSTFKVRDGVAVPCFLKDVTIPMLRAGQQFQVVMKLLELCKNVATGANAFEDILPGWSCLSSNNTSYSTPLSFEKEKIESTVLLRKKFYKRLLEKLECIMGNLGIKLEQVVMHDNASDYVNDSNEGIDAQLSLFPAESSLSPLAAEKRVSNETNNQNEGSEESPVDLDPLESSECSSVEGSEEQEVLGQPAEIASYSHELEQSYLSALCFSSGITGNNSLKQIPEAEKSNLKQSGLLKTFHPKHSSGLLTDPCNKEATLRDAAISQNQLELSRSWISKIDYAGNDAGLGWPVGGLLQNPFSSDMERGTAELHLSGNHMQLNNSDIEISENSMLCFTKQFLPECLNADFSQRDDFVDRTNHLPNSYVVQPWNINSPSNLMSMNPMLTRNAFLKNVSEPEMKDALKVSRNFPFFNFSSANDPIKLFLNKLPTCPEHRSGSNVESASDVHHVDSFQGSKFDPHSISSGKENIAYSVFSMLSMDNIQHSTLNGARGGSTWESLFSSYYSSRSESFDDCGHVPAYFEIPLTFVIDKCLSQEILLQYHYVSRLTMKILEIGFNMEQHLLALRRYFFMETADWADYFVASLWHHKSYFMEANQKIPEIQGLLEISIQRSSCEKDVNKSRLYVYLKDHTVSPISAAAEGVCSLNFIGLGYRVDWPVSIVLTPSALKIYSKIFSFLIQVKLAVLSLSDVWCSLKDFRNLVIRGDEQHQLEWSNFNCLMKLRHQVNHFISTLQQYVLSQLSDVSWCRFLYSLKHQVRDMMDLESVHMAYLSDSLHICFLADETRSISEIIVNNLQCALDLRSCLVKEMVDMRPINGGSTSIPWKINTTQMLSTKQRFNKNMKELHCFHLKSPKHAQFGLSRFWSHLNYNDYYSGLFCNEMLHFSLSTHCSRNDE